MDFHLSHVQIQTIIGVKTTEEIKSSTNLRKTIPVVKRRTTTTVPTKKQEHLMNIY